MENKVKGDLYEQYICDYLNTKFPGTSAIKIAYLWKDVPEELLYQAKLITEYNEHRLKRKNGQLNENANPLQDFGIDIVMVKKNGQIYFVQCKNYSGTIGADKLGGFSIVMMARPDKFGRIYYTSQLSRQVSEQIGGCTNVKAFRQPMPKKVIEDDEEEPQVVKLYPYQKKIVDKYIEYYKKSDRSILTMPCGTGKTIISCYIGKNYDRIIFIAPLRQFAEQNITRFNEYESDRKSLLIDSDGCRDVNEIKKFIKHHKKTLLSVTYDSCDVIQDFLKESFIIVDEFHNLSKTNVFNENDPINNILCSDSKILFMSATPRVYEIENCDDISAEDNQSIFGETVLKMDFKTAIENKYICDYKIYLPTRFGKTYAQLTKSIGKNICSGKIPCDIISKQCCFLFEAIKSLGTLKCIIYFKRCKDIDSFVSAFKRLNEYYAYDYTMASITYTDSKTDRNKKLKEFNDSKKISFLCSVRILNECIDIPTCNSIYVTYNCKSKISCIQRMCRSMRIDKSNLHKIANILLFCEEIDEVLTFMSAVKEMDLDFKEKINYLKCSDNLRDQEEIDETNQKLNEKYKKKLMRLRRYHGFSWNNMLEKATQYIDEHGKKPSRFVGSTENKQIGRWLNSQKFNYSHHRFIMTNDKIRAKWEKFVTKYHQHFRTNTEIWNDKLDEVKKYIVKNHKLPSKHSKTPKIHKLGEWISDQRKNYPKKIKIMNDNTFRKKWRSFITEYSKYFVSIDDAWNTMLTNVKNYIDKYGIRPSGNSKDSEIMHMGRWILQQNNDYTKKRYSMGNKEKRLKWKQFIGEYSKYFMSYKEIWCEKLELVKKYIDKHKTIPLHTAKDDNVRSLGCWLADQRKNYPRKLRTMKNKDIREKWKEFLKTYGTHTKSKKDNWYESLDEVKKYIDSNKKRPASTSKDSSTRKLGYWITHQIVNYSRRLYIMTQENYRNSWENFIKEYKEYFGEHYKVVCGK